MRDRRERKVPKEKGVGAVTMKALRAFALRLPEATEGVACEGTALEKRTAKVRGKAFVFLNASEAMVKLRDSTAEAARFPKASPDACRVGGHGWAVVKIGEGGAVQEDVLERWIHESYRLMAPASLVGTPGEARPAPKGKTR